MQLSANILRLLNSQISNEYYSMLAYTAIGTQADAMGLPKTQEWADKEAQEEYGHAMRLINFVRDRSQLPQALVPVPAPPAQYSSLLEMFQALLALMKGVITPSLQGIHDAAVAENDAPTVNLMEWYLEQQVQAEKSLETYVIRTARNSPVDLLDAVLFD